MANKEELYQKIKSHAEAKGGTLLSKEYSSAKTKMEFKCSNEKHPSWLTTPDQVLSKDSWCVNCHKDSIQQKNKQKFFIDAQEIAKEKGGTLLSTEFISAKSPMLWKCSNPDHEPFTQNLDKVKSRGTWCRDCSDYVKRWTDSKDIATQYAKSKGGFVIFPKNTDEIKTNTMLTWKCSNLDHPHWQADFRNTTNGSWCPRCAGRFTNTEFIEQAHQFAKLNGGHCLTNSYQDQNSLFTFKCADPTHPEWTKTFSYSVVNKNWCKACKNNPEINVFKKLQLKQAQDFAINKNGKCLSTTYNVSNEKLTWQCEEGHEWQAKFSNIIYNNRWCPTCAGKLSPEELLIKANAYAKKNKGQCLTTDIPFAQAEVEWKCIDSTHSSWKVSLTSIFHNKSWCPECGYTNYYRENTFKAILETLLGYSLEKSFVSWNINPQTNKLLEFDGYNEEHKFAFEFQGRHHKQLIFKNQDLLDTQYKDQLKVENCQKNGVTLLVIHDEKKFSEIDSCIETVKTELKKLNIDFNDTIDKENLTEQIWKKCKNEEKKTRLKNAQETAQSKGGICLSKHYFNYHTNMQWKCSVSTHPKWSSPYASVVGNGTWCRECYKDSVKKKKP